MKNFKSTKIYQFFYQWYMNKYIYTDEFIENMDFSHSLFDNYSEAIDMLKIFKDINEKIKNENLDNKFVLNFYNEDLSSILTFNKEKNIFEFKPSGFIDKSYEIYKVNSILFFEDNNIFNNLNKKNNTIDFVKHMDGFYKAIIRDNKVELFKSINMINGDSFNIEKITLLNIYLKIKNILKDKLIAFYNVYNNEIEKINSNIILLNNKVVHSFSFNILNDYSEENFIDNPREYSYLSLFKSKEEYEFKSKHRLSAHTKLYFSQQKMNSNTISYNLKNIEIFNNIQNQSKKFFDILENFKQIKYFFAENRNYHGAIAFLSCQNKNTGKTIFNPLINEYEDLYCLEGDVIISDNRKELCYLKVYYTKHTLFYFKVKSKTKEEVKEIFDKGFSNYYQKYRLQDSFENF